MFDGAFEKALTSIKPNALWSIKGEILYKNLTWHDLDQSKPTEEELNNEIARLQEEYDAQAYARNRVPEYPSTGDQLDMMYKDTKNSTTTHAAAVEAVKTKWPKDNSGPV